MTAEEPGVEAPLWTDRERAESVQVGLEGVLLSSCSAAGMWRVRDLAGLGRDDFFSGLRYALSFSTHFLDRGDGREHAEEGRASQSSACTRGLRLRLQAEPGRGGSRSNPRRCTAIFNTTALVGLDFLCRD